MFLINFFFKSQKQTLRFLYLLRAHTYCHSLALSLSFVLGLNNLKTLKEYQIVLPITSFFRQKDRHVKICLELVQMAKKKLYISG
jgi:hypothetical protein